MPMAAQYYRPINSWQRIAVTVIGLLAVTAARPAQAQVLGRAPWCVEMADLGDYLDCHYFTHAQCRATAWGVSNTCVRNPWYVAAPPIKRPRRAPRK